jgi:hypothetical protein
MPAVASSLPTKSNEGEWIKDGSATRRSDSETDTEKANRKEKKKARKYFRIYAI